MGIETDWNCAISLRPLEDSSQPDPHRMTSTYADWDVKVQASYSKYAFGDLFFLKRRWCTYPLTSVHSCVFPTPRFINTRLGSRMGSRQYGIISSGWITCHCSFLFSRMQPLRQPRTCSASTKNTTSRFLPSVCPIGEKRVIKFTHHDLILQKNATAAHRFLFPLVTLTTDHILAIMLPLGLPQGCECRPLSGCRSVFFCRRPAPGSASFEPAACVHVSLLGHRCRFQQFCRGPPYSSSPWGCGEMMRL